MGEERRKFPRIAVLDADLRVAQVAAYRLIGVVDFSLGGLKVEIEVDDEPPKVSTLLDVHLELSQGPQVVNATVRHVTALEPAGSKRYHLGVEFDDPDLVSELLGEWYGSQVKG